MPVRQFSHSADLISRLLAGDMRTVSDRELFSVLLGEDTLAAGELLQAYSLDKGIWEARGCEVERIEGVDREGAARVVASLEIARRSGSWAAGERFSITRPEDVVSFCEPLLRGRDREHFWMLALDTRAHLIEVVEVSIGSLSISVVHPRELFRDAIRLSAASVILVHNHPSGDPNPSEADIKLTKRLVEAGHVLGIEVLDHIILGEIEFWASLKDLGFI